MKRILIDTDVMVAALGSATGRSRQVLLKILDGEIEAAASVPLFMEYEAVLTRPANLDRSGLTREEVVAFLDDLATMIIPVGLHYNWRPVASDPDDDLVLEAAINGNIDTILSFNIRDLARGAASFGVEVLRPAEFMERMEDG